MTSPLQFIPIAGTSFTDNIVNVENKKNHNKIINYTALSSSNYDENTKAFKAFNKNNKNDEYWQSDTFPNPKRSKPTITNPKVSNPYVQTPYKGESSRPTFSNKVDESSSNDGSYQGGGRNNNGYYTTEINNLGKKNGVDGEWLQIQLPFPVVLSSYSILVPKQEGNINHFPEKFTLAGSSDGTSWNYIDFQDVKSHNYSCNNREPISFPLSTIYPYSYYRLIISKMPINNSVVRINQFSLFGLPEHGSHGVKEHFIGLGNYSLSPQFDNDYPSLNIFSNIEPFGSRYIPQKRTSSAPAKSSNSRSSNSQSSAAAPAAVVSLSMNNININAQGAGAIEQASQIVNDPNWETNMVALENASNSYGHKCGTGRDPKKSLDSEAVDALNDLKNKTNDLKNKATNFKNLFFDPNGNSGSELQRVKGLLKHDFYKDQRSISAATNSVSRLIGDQVTRSSALDDSQEKIKKEYIAKKDTLNHRKDELNGKIDTSNAIKATKQWQYAKLQTIKPGADDNALKLQSNNGALDTTSELNQVRLDYLNSRVTNTHSEIIDNYEKLYKSTILQNELLKKNENDTKMAISTVQRKTEFASSSKSFVYNIYTKMMLFYYILVVIFAGFLFFSQKTWSFYTKIAIFILSIIYPFTVIYIETWIYNLWLYILSIISGSVYTYRSLL